MAQLYFYYGAMNAGKSTTLLQASFNYRERGMTTLLFTAAVDDRAGIGRIGSRIGLKAEARVFRSDMNMFEAVSAAPPDCVLVDEAQFLTTAQVDQLASVVDRLNVPVLAYGLRTDFVGQLFAGSERLLAIADKLVELKAVCHCGRKAVMNLRVDASGAAVTSGAQTEIGGNDRYMALCRRHWSEAMAAAA
ncbi:MAG: thymidine kinase [Sandaracinobacter sp.]